MNGSIGAFPAWPRSAASCLAALLAGCAVVPKTTAPAAPPARVEQAPVTTPRDTAPPSGEARHRIALLVPLSGENEAVGRAMANAALMALIDTEASDLRITNYDTAGADGPGGAAAQAVQDGNALILGPLLGENIGPVLASARPRDVPVISFSNNTELAGSGAYILGIGPDQSVARSIRYARGQGARTFAALIPEGEYGARAEAAFRDSVAGVGGEIGAVERYARGNTSIVSAARRVKGRAPDAVYVADGPEWAARAARELGSGIQIIGSELWAGDAEVAALPTLRGAIFSAVSDTRYRQFADSYRARFGEAPYRVATLGYDAVLLTLNVGEKWPYDRPFPHRALLDEDGFLGLDGPLRFARNGAVRRALEVREVRAGEVAVVDAAPTRFE